MLFCILQVEGGSPSPSDLRLYSDAVEAGRTALDNKTSLLNTPSPRSFTLQRFRDYNPHNYDVVELRLNGASLMSVIARGALSHCLLHMVFYVRKNLMVYTTHLECHKVLYVS